MKLRTFLPHGLLMLLFAASAFTPFSLALTTARTGLSDKSYPSGSWGLGIVVPEGSQYADGGRLSWKNTTNVTAVVQLPSIDYTDDTIYVILSAMAEDGSVFQIAAGINPNMTTWLAYAFFIQDVRTYPQSYILVLNSSKPEMAAGDWVTLSIYISSRHWNYRVDDIATRESVHGNFMFNATPSFRIGDQEVFALESYSRTNLVFEHMASLVLSSLLVDGRKITKGWYFYGDWDSSHNPLFVVGGLNPPAFMSVRRFDNDTVAWSYVAWTGSEQALPYYPGVIISVLLPVVVVITTSAVVFKTRKRLRY